jgi:SPP1 gp7 family putative phage head morphogenesis protein
VNEKLFYSILAKLREGMEKGTGEKWLGQNFASDNYELYAAMKQNLFYFSAARTYQELKEIQGLLYENGVLVSKETFKARVKEFVEQANRIDKKYNETWLATEYDFATNQSRANQRWQGFVNNSDIFPNLEYVAINDERTRESHRKLDGVIRPVSDAFWDTYAPLKAWGCRCYLVATDKPVTEELPTDLPEIPAEFQGNRAKEGTIFSPKHAYFDIPAQDATTVKDRAKNLETAYRIAQNKALFDKILVDERFSASPLNFNKKTGGFIAYKAGITNPFSQQSLVAMETLSSLGFGVVAGRNENDMSIDGSKTELRNSTSSALSKENYMEMLRKQNDDTNNIVLHLPFFNRPNLLAAINELRNAADSPFKAGAYSLTLLRDDKLVTISRAELRRQEATNQKINAL